MILTCFQKLNIDAPGLPPPFAPFIHIEFNNYGASFPQVQTCSSQGAKTRLSKGAGTGRRSLQLLRAWTLNRIY